MQINKERPDSLEANLAYVSTKQFIKFFQVRNGTSALKQNKLY